MKEYGDNLGIAFQIVDDILDFTSTEAAMGKPVGSDLIQGTLTLPAMMIMERYPEDNPIRKFFETRDNKYVARAIEIVLNSDIVKDCYGVAGEYRDRACRNLKSLPKPEIQKPLLDLAEFIIRQGT
jgi:octaprenyl-diphosphate synthase